MNRLLLTASATLALAALLAAGTASAQATIYRCHKLDGQLVFQDKPCDQSASTREAQRGQAGEVVPNAPPAPAVEGPSLTERYENYVDAEDARRERETATGATDRGVTIGGSSRTHAATAVPSGIATPESGYGGYGGYSEGTYPYAYPAYPAYPRRPVADKPRPGISTSAVTPPPSSALTAPSNSFRELDAARASQNQPPRSSPPGHVVSRDPNAK